MIPFETGDFSDNGNNEAAPGVERAIESCLVMHEQLPDHLKEKALHQEMPLLFSGFKAAADLIFVTPGDNNTVDADLHSIDTVVNPLGIKRILTHQMVMPSITLPPGLLTTSMLYDPNTVAAQTQGTDLVLPYTSEMDIKVWWAKNLEAGKSEDALYGKLFGFPESAIRDYLNAGGSSTAKPHMLLNPYVSIGIDPRDRYAYSGVMGLDAREREAKKLAILQNWAADPRIKLLLAKYR